MAAYKVEVDTEGCKECGHGKLYRVVGPDDVATSTLWSEVDDADHEARILNGAFEEGRKAMQHEWLRKSLGERSGRI